MTQTKIRSLLLCLIAVFLSSIYTAAAAPDPCFDPSLTLLSGDLPPNWTISFRRPYSAGTRVVATAELGAATAATFSSGLGPDDSPGDPTSVVPGTIIHDFYVAGDYWVNIHNFPDSDGTIQMMIRCEPIPGFVYGTSETTETTLLPSLPVNLLDGRINRDTRYDVAAPIAVYNPLDIYAIHPENSQGQLVLRLTQEEISAAGMPQDGNYLLAETTNPFTGQLITVYRLTTDELQINTTYADGKPYIIVWPSDAPEKLYHLSG